MAFRVQAGDTRQGCRRPPERGRRRESDRPLGPRGAHGPADTGCSPRALCRPTPPGPSQKRVFSATQLVATGCRGDRKRTQRVNIRRQQPPGPGPEAGRGMGPEAGRGVGPEASGAGTGLGREASGRRRRAKTAVGPAPAVGRAERRHRGAARSWTPGAESTGHLAQERQVGVGVSGAFGQNPHVPGGGGRQAAERMRGRPRGGASGLPAEKWARPPTRVLPHAACPPSPVSCINFSHKQQHTRPDGTLFKAIDRPERPPLS